jgi:hypothetical protein
MIRSNSRIQQLLWWPLLRAVQDAEHPDFTAGLKDLVNRYEWERREGDLSRALNAPRASEVRECFQCADAFDHGLRHSSCGVRTAFCNVVANSLEIVRGVRRPADAH